MSDSLTKIKIVVYKKVVAGDIKKFFARSNDKDTGGGARDLRYSPAKMFFPIFNRMFRIKKDDGTYTGQFFWPDCEPTDVTIHPPTNSRASEIRIGTVNKCIPEKHRPDSERDLIFILIMDCDDKVWPYFITEQSLREEDWHPKIKERIISGLEAKRNARVTPMGYIDIENGGSYTNGTER